MVQINKNIGMDLLAQLDPDTQALSIRSLSLSIHVLIPLQDLFSSKVFQNGTHIIRSRHTDY
jgi:hypothetical protein